MLGKDTKHRTEYNKNGHFLYHAPPGPHRRKRKDRLRKNRGGNPEETERQLLTDYHGRQAESQRKDTIPEATRMTFDEWLELANKTHVDMEDEHWYFRLIACGYMGPEGDCDMGSSE